MILGDPFPNLRGDSVQVVEFSSDDLIIGLMRQPRFTHSRGMVRYTRTIALDRSDPTVAALIEELAQEVHGICDRIIAAAEQGSMSLEQFEAAEEDSANEDLGMGDD